VVAPFLWRNKIRTVDILVLSHPDADHLNGLLYIAENFHVKQLWSTGDQAHVAAYRRLLEISMDQGIDRVEFSRLTRTHDINGTRVDILHPPADFLKKPSVKTAGSRNNNSLVLRVSRGAHSLLMPGDLMARGEAQLVRAHGPALHSTVLLAPHHGSRTSSTAAFLQRVDPAAVIVSAAARGRSRHPHPSVMKRYVQRGADVFCTATAGAVMVLIDDDSVRILPFLGRSGAARSPRRVASGYGAAHTQQPRRKSPAHPLGRTDQPGSIQPAAGAAGFHDETAIWLESNRIAAKS
jgi:competence protein ComEC